MEKSNVYSIFYSQVSARVVRFLGISDISSKQKKQKRFLSQKARARKNVKIVEWIRKAELPFFTSFAKCLIGWKIEFRTQSEIFWFGLLSVSTCDVTAYF